jgi:hypothetical protein
VEAVEIPSDGSGLPVGTRLVVLELPAAELPPILPSRPHQTAETTFPIVDTASPITSA